jgi:raffinose/stachyose/melibiose transport system substrate-binding protein
MNGHASTVRKESTALRHWFTIVLIVAVLVLTVGVSTGASRHQGTTPSGTLNAEVTTSNAAPWPILIANFERVFPDVKVSYTAASGSALIAQVLAQFQAGNPPDWYTTNAAGASANGPWTLGPQGKLLDLSGSPWVKRISKEDLASVTWKGKVYGLPLALNINGAVYNADLVKQLGITIPQTTAQIINMCKKAKAAGKYAFSLALGPDASVGLFGWSVSLAANFVYAFDPNWTAERNAHKVTFANSPLWHNAYYWLLQMNKAGCFNPAPQGTSQNSAYAMVANGQAVATVGQSAITPIIQALNPNIHLGFFSLPGPVANKSIITYQIAPVLVAPATTPNPAAVKEFFDFMGRPKQAALFAKVNNGISTYDALKGNVPPIMSALSPAFAAGRSMQSPNNFWPNPNEHTVCIWPGFLALFTGQTTIDKILACADYLWDNPTATAAP